MSGETTAVRLVMSRESLTVRPVICGETSVRLVMSGETAVPVRLGNLLQAWSPHGTFLITLSIVRPPIFVHFCRAVLEA